jgi:hypothetical protein
MGDAGERGSKGKEGGGRSEGERASWCGVWQLLMVEKGWLPLFTLLLRGHST